MIEAVASQGSDEPLHERVLPRTSRCAEHLLASTNDMIAIPNSVVAKAVVTNHSQANDLHICTVRVKINHTVSPARVIDTLQAAARSSAGIPAGTLPTAYACEFSDALVTYEVAFAVDSFTVASRVQSDVIARVTDDCQRTGIKIGTPAMDVRLIQQGYDAVANRMAPDAAVHSSRP
jgi:small-conductance mechanosensitive channel